MTATEHSRLIYLLDAIDSAPDKVDILVAIVAREDASPEYDKILLQLLNSNDLAITSSLIRDSLR